MNTAEASGIPLAEDGRLHTIIERLIHLYRPERIYLFGCGAPVLLAATKRPRTGFPESCPLYH